MLLQPDEIPCRRGGPGDDEKRIAVQPGNREVSLYTTIFVKPLSIADVARCDCRIAGADILENGFGVGAFQAELGKGRHIEERHAFAGG